MAASMGARLTLERIAEETVSAKMSNTGCGLDVGDQGRMVDHVTVQTFEAGQVG